MRSVHLSVLHVLPHPGGGGERYVDILDRAPMLESERVFLASGPQIRGNVSSALRTSARINALAASFEVLHIHGEASALLCLPAIARHPSVLTLHGLNLARRLGQPLRAAAILNLRAIVRAATRTICVSESERSELLAYLSGSLRARVLTIVNGVDTVPTPAGATRSTIRRQLGIDENALLAVWVGALETPKDPIEPALAAMQLASGGLPFVLAVVGEGSLRVRLERMTSAPGGDAVRLLGARSDVSAILAAADLFVLASQREGLPFSLLEAMAHGLPAVVSNVPGCVEAVGDAGVVVEGSEVTRFVDAFANLAADPERRRVLGLDARERARRCFSAVEMIERTRTLYGEVVKAANGPA